MARFKEAPQDPKQVLLFATSVDDAIPADAEVRVLSEVMENLDWSELESSYSDVGCPAYPPRVLGKVLVYAYSNGVRSSRKIEELVENDKRYIWLAGGLRPDHNTIARFRKGKHEQLRALFTESVRLCAEAGLVMLRVVSVDSTKIAASASKRSLYNEARAEKELAAIEEILGEAEEIDAAEDELYGEGNGRELPDDLKDPVKRREKIAQVARRLKAEKVKSISATDPDCRVMKVSGRKRPAYSVQAAVDSENQVIVGMELTQSANDSGKLPEMVEEVESNTGLRCETVLADRGYSDEETFKWLKEKGQDALVVPKEHPSAKRNDLFCSRCFLPDEENDELICPAGRRLCFQGEYRTGSGRYRLYGATGCWSCSFHKKCVSDGKGSRRVSVSSVSAAREQMRQRLASTEGKLLYGLRKQTVEPVFGQMKSNMRFDRFLLWGKTGATAEAALICLAHNLKKCVRQRAATARAAFCCFLQAVVGFIEQLTHELARQTGYKICLSAQF